MSLRDPTSTLRAEEALRRASRALRVLAVMHEELASAADKPDLCRRICGVMVSAFGYAAAWIGLAEGEERPQLRLVASAGCDEGHPGALAAVASDPERGRGPWDVAVRSGAPAIVQRAGTDPDFAPLREAATARGWAAVAALPLPAEGRILGALVICSREPDVFDAEEISLLREVARATSRVWSLLRADRERMQAEARLAEVLDTIGVVAWTARHSDGQVTYASQAAEQVFGRPMRDLLGRPGIWKELIHPDDQPVWVEAIASLAELGRAELDVRSLRSDGEIRWLHVSLRAVRAERGDIVSRAGIAYDITARKAAELGRIEAERRFREIADHTSETFWTFDVKTRRLEFVNQNLQATWGRDLQIDPRDPGASFLPRIHPADRDRVAAAIARTYAGEASDFEFRMVQSDGEIRWRHFRSFAVRDGAGPVVHMAGISRDITEQRVAEIALRESNALLQTVIDSLPFRLTVLDREGIILAVNSGPPGDADDGCEPHPDAGIGERYLAALAEDSPLDAGIAARIREEIRAVLEGRSGGFEIEYECAGRTRWCVLRAAPITLPEGRARGIVLREDITERRRAAKAVRRSEERLGRIVDAGWDIVALVDSAGRIEWTSGAWERVLGKPAAAFVGMSSEQLTYEEDLPLRERTRRVVLSNPGEVARIEIRWKHADGHPVWIGLSVANLIHDPAVGALVLNGRDISERKRAEATLLELNAVLERRVAERTAELMDLYDNAPCGYYSLGPDGTILQMNGTALRWLGYTRDEVVGKLKVQDLLTPEGWERFERSDSESVAGKGVSAVDMDLVRRDGTAMHAVINATALRDAGGRATMTRITVFDNTERYRMEQRLRQANAALERANRAKDEFLAAMSHELRTPLNAVLGLSELLQEEVHGPVTEAQRATLGRIQESGRHLLALINDILDLAKVAAGSISLDLRPVDVHELCRASLRFVHETAQRKRLTVSFGMQYGGPPALLDERRMKQVLVNLLSNAVKFTPEGGRFGLEFATDEDAGTMRFVVWDSGIGIAAEDMPRLFKPFVQLDSRLSRVHPGTGLGLALVRQLVDLHGGSVAVESQPGKGSRFTVTLALRPATGELPSASPGKTVRAPGARAGEPRRLLLAEDDEINVTTMCEFLTAYGYEVHVARDGKEAIALALELRPEVILMDIQMPVLDGIAATRAIRAGASPEVRATPIIALTALVMPGDEARCLDAGADTYVTKPVSLRKLVTVIEELVAARGTA